MSYWIRVSVRRWMCMLSDPQSTPMVVVHRHRSITKNTFVVAYRAIVRSTFVLSMDVMIFRSR